MRLNIVNEELPYYLSLAQGHMVTHAEPFRFSMMQGRMHYGFIHLLKGSVRYEFPEENTALQIRQGQIVYLPKDCRYICVYPAEETVVAILNFDLFPQSKSELPKTVTILPEDNQRFFKGFSIQRIPMNALQCSARVYDLMDALLKAQPSPPKKYRRLQPAIAHMENNPFEDTDVNLYAKLCGMSVPAFHRSFREYVGMPPIEYRNNLRLHYAKMLLSSGEYSVEEAARKSGFNNISFFYRLFRRKFGVSPGKF